MGNCFAACLQQKQSITEIPPSVGGESTSRLTKGSLTSASVALERLRRNKIASATISKVLRSGRNNRVSPCDNGGSARNAARINTPREGSNHSSRRAGQPSDSSGFSESSLKTLSSRTIYEEYLSGSCQPFDEIQVKSRTPSPFIQPGITKGRLIIVQPCRSMSSTSYAEEISAENVPCGSPAKMFFNEQPKAVESSEICTSTSSIGSWTDDPQDIELDLQSEDESCQVFPYPRI